MKIVFLTSNINEPRVPNRISEFKARGYELEVFCYSRDSESPFMRESDVPYHVLGEVGRGSSSYFKRLFSEYRDVRRVIRLFSGQDVIFYLLNNDMALLYCIIGGKCPFIYEEADLRHTYFSSKLLRNLFERIDKRIVRKSLLTVFMSKGFSTFHYGTGAVPANVTYMFNKLNPGVSDLNYERSRIPDAEHLKIAFVGSIRFDSVFNFAKVMCSSFSNHEFHFYGKIVEDRFNDLKSFSNCYFHGPFSNPKDLPSIYSEIDLVLSTYDTRFDNVRYAEPNKIYESAYFEVPIIVSDGTYLSQRVLESGIGYSVDAMNDEEIVRFISSLTKEDIISKSLNASKISKKDCILNNGDFFNTLRERLENII